jgi:hypothetical protein
MPKRLNSHIFVSAISNVMEPKMWSYESSPRYARDEGPNSLSSDFLFNRSETGNAACFTCKTTGA